MILSTLAEADYGTWMIVLLAAAALFYLLEILTPSFGILLSFGLLSFVAAVICAYQLDSTGGTIVLVVGAIGTPVYLYFVTRWLPNSPIGRAVFLKKARSATDEATPMAHELERLVGQSGVAVTTLRPSGVVTIEGHRYDAVAEMGLIEKDTPVTVLRAGGTDVVVARVNEQ
jgi:membrane-bound serine protease (ClpP class)